jgi:hypothetical protein
MRFMDLAALVVFAAFCVNNWVELSENFTP